MALKKSQLYSSLWASCDELRGSMDASQYKDYVLVLLFVKYISDRYAGQPYAAITIPPGASFANMVALKGKPDIGDQINKNILGPLARVNKLADMPDFNDPAKLGSGKEMVERLTNLVAIFENPALDFSKNRADGDDLLGDAYEYLMRHFATQSGKSKGQFYTPAEISRVIAQLLGVREASATARTTVYDPTCGSGSLLLRVAEEAAHGRDVRVTLYGQEKDNATAGLARMNMILHDYATAEIRQGNTLVSPLFLKGEALDTFDYVVSNPPFSDKSWSTGLDPEHDPYNRFAPYGVPPQKQGDFAYLLHILRSLRPTGKGACILPHGVLFRGGAEGTIRRNLVQRGYIRGIIGLPPNLFFGTGIPACIVVLDKEGAAARKGIFLIDASKGFRKEGPKNRLRAQDIHKIVDTFTRASEVRRYARMVPVAEISDSKNDYNLNLPRYIDSTEPEDLQDIGGHLRGGIPSRDIDACEHYWKVVPTLRASLFKPAAHTGYYEVTVADVKSTILGHREFIAFRTTVEELFATWKTANRPHLTGFSQGALPKELIEVLSESLFAEFARAPLLDAYDTYQHLMNQWDESMQDDCYLIAASGWVKGAQPREIEPVKNKANKLSWPEPHDYLRGKRRFKSDLVPASILVARYFVAEREAIEALDHQLATLEQQLDEMREEQCREEGLLAEANDAKEGENAKITAKSLRAALLRVGKDAEDADERGALEAYAHLLEQQSEAKADRRAAQAELDGKIDGKYPKLTEAEIKTMVIDDKWLAHLSAAVQGEIDRVSHTLADRIRQVAERYATALPKLTDKVEGLAARVEEHLKNMGAVWI